MKNDKPYISFKGDPHSVIWKSDITELTKKARVYGRKDCNIIFLRKGTLLGTFDDREEYYIINDKASAFGPLFKREKTITECHIYYINKVVQLENKWGTPNKIDVHDKGYNMHTSVGANGSYKFSIDNPMILFSKVQGAYDNLTQDMVHEFFRSELNMEIRNAIATVFLKRKYGLDDIAIITTKEKEIAQDIKEVLEPIFLEYGVKLEKFYIERFAYDEEFLNSLSEIKKQNILDKVDFKESKDLRKGQRKEAKKIVNKEIHNVVYCNNCGQQNKEESRFCSKCGNEL